MKFHVVHMQSMEHETATSYCCEISGTLSTFWQTTLFSFVHVNYVFTDENHKMIKQFISPPARSVSAALFFLQALVYICT